MADEDDPELWLARSNRRAALRVLAVGLLVLVPSSIWLGLYHDWDLSTSPGHSRQGDRCDRDRDRCDLDGRGHRDAPTSIKAALIAPRAAIW